MVFHKGREWICGEVGVHVFGVMGAIPPESRRVDAKSRILLPVGQTNLIELSLRCKGGEQRCGSLPFCVIGCR